MRYLILFSLAFSILSPRSALADETACFQSGKTCSDVDIDSPKAEAAYRRGCDAGESYACSRLGQLFDVRRNDQAQALAFYDRGCRAGDAFGCGQAGDLRPKLCFVENKKQFCDGKEPAGDYRAYMFLKTLVPQYADAFRDHDFDKPFSFQAATDLFARRVKERNHRLLRALRDARKKGHHDGVDAEVLDSQIKCIAKNQCPELGD